MSGRCDGGRRESDVKRRCGGGRRESDVNRRCDDVNCSIIEGLGLLATHSDNPVLCSAK